MGLRRLYKNIVANRAAEKRNSLKEIEYHGIRVPLVGDHIAPPIRQQLLDGIYEVPELEAAASLVRPNDRVLELGAGMGVVTAALSRAVSDTGKVLTFEANPNMLEPLNSLISMNEIKNVEVRQGVLSEGDEPVRHFNFAQYFPESSLLDVKSQQGSTEVPSFKLASVFEDFRPDVFICDTEGAEAELIPLITGFNLRAAVIELHPAVLSDAEIALIYDTMIADHLYPRVEHSSENVVAFERIDPSVG